LPADDNDDDDDAVTAADVIWCHRCTGRLAIYSTPMTAGALIMDIHSAIVSPTDVTLYRAVDVNVSESLTLQPWLF